MAIVCRTHHLLFIQAPRTGCTAIEALLLDRFGGERLPATDILGPDGFIRMGRKHCTVRQLLVQGLIPENYSSLMTAVTAVRNPFDSLVSLYVKKSETYHERFLKDPNSWVHKVRGYVEDMEFCRTHSFEEWLTKRYAVSTWEKVLGRGRRSLYGRYTEGTAIVMRFERLQEDFESVMRGLGIHENVTIPKINITGQRSRRYQDYYTTGARELVEYVFKPELDQYGYSFEGLQETAAVPQAAGSR